jgi:hypothetical protein
MGKASAAMQPGDVVIVGGVTFRISEVTSTASLSITRLRWYHKIIYWFKRLDWWMEGRLEEMNERRV